MFKISSEQIRTFQPDAEEAFIGRVMEYLKENHADEKVQIPDGKVEVGTLPEKTLRELVRGGLKRAAEHGIEWKSTLLSYLVLMFAVAPNFDRHPKARRFFSENETIDDERFEIFLDEMTDEDYAAIDRRYDVKAWNLPLVEGENG